MRHRAVRITLFLLAVALMGGSGYRVFDLERRVAADTERSRSFELQAQQILRNLGELRAAQAGYVAAGQGHEFWTKRVAALLQEATAGLDALRQRALDETVGAILAESQKSLAQFRTVDGRARDHVIQGQLLLASDVIFDDGLEFLGATASQLDQAREQRRQALDRLAGDLRRQELYTLLGAGALVLFLMLTLVPTAGHADVDSQVFEMDLRSTAQPSELTPGLEPEVRGAPARSSGPLLNDLGTPLTAELTAAAALCLDMARVASSEELRTLFERTAELVQAKGIVLWMPTPSGELRPVLAQGYSPQVAARMPSLAPDADNATAAAYRSGKLREVRAAGSATGAVIAPLPNAAGCSGVLAVELPAGVETSATVQAIITLIAAQLAGLVSAAAPIAKAGPSHIAGTA